MYENASFVVSSVKYIYKFNETVLYQLFYNIDQSKKHGRQRQDKRPMKTSTGEIIFILIASQVFFEAETKYFKSKHEHFFNLSKLIFSIKK